MSDKKHVVVIPHSAWGHLRPVLHLVVNLLTVHPNLHCTILLAPSISAKCNAELASPALAHIRQGDNPVENRLQCFHVMTPSQSEKDLFGRHPEEEAKEFGENLPRYLLKLFGKDGEVGVEEMKNKFGDLEPTLGIFDWFQFFVPNLIEGLMQSLEHEMLPLMCTVACSPSSAYHHWATEEHGGFVARTTRLADLKIAKGRDQLEVWSELCFQNYGEVVKLPGLPAKYDFEFFLLGGSAPPPPFFHAVLSGAGRVLRDPLVKGVIQIGTYELEPEAITSLTGEFEKPFIPRRVCQALWMQFPEVAWAGKSFTNETKPSGDDEKVLAFLTGWERNMGVVRSLTSGHFGTLWFPFLRPELARYILDSLLDNNIPVVFGYAGSLSQGDGDGVLTEEFLEKLNANENCIAVKFAPQWAVLEHPSTAFFITHCGTNSMVEAILARQPLVCMPLNADHGENSSLMSDVYKTGITPKQIMTPKGGLEKFHTLLDGTEVIGTEEAIKIELADIWTKMKGEEGEEFRRNMGKVRDIC